ncbi:MAG TPA: cupin domain-containing protein [Mucilaginibacter sp.]
MSTIKYQLPKTIENCVGERLVFKEIVREADGDKVIIEGFFKPKSGPPMHVHLKQEECITVKKGKIAYQLSNERENFASEGETVLFERGTAHRFWNAGSGELQLEGWVKPANNIIFYLSAIYEAQNKSGSKQPELFDAAYLNMTYRSEFDTPSIPPLVKNVFIPLVYFIGKLTGKYKKFDGAPEAVR